MRKKKAKALKAMAMLLAKNSNPQDEKKIYKGLKKLKINKNG